MGKKHKSAAQEAAPASAVGFPFAAGGDAVDPTLASLFDKSAGPVLAPQFTAQQQSVSLGGNERKTATNREDNNATVLSTDLVDEGGYGDEEMGDGTDEQISSDVEDSDSEENSPEAISSMKEPKRKRKRGDRDDNLEESYMRRIAEEEARERKKQMDDQSSKRRKVDGQESPEKDGPGAESDSESSSEAEDAEDDKAPIPAHESTTNTNPDESSALEKSSRTVFLGNVSTSAIKSKSARKTLETHLTSFFPSLTNFSGTPKIESIRFRSTAFSSTALPKRAAYAKRELMDSTTRSTNAYVVYSTVAAAKKALSLNGSIVLDRHLRVDSVAHPSKVDHRRCVFVGNLSFVDEETAEEPENDAGEKKKKKKQKDPADSEEGLWRIFNEHTKAKSNSSKTATTTSGSVESVRVIRDRSTRVGKGFAYVQFHDENAVEAALLLDGQKFPPLLPRKLRVVRAKRSAATKPSSGSTAQRPGAKPGTESVVQNDRSRSLAGRAARMLGQAGAVKLREKEKEGAKSRGKYSNDRAATGANAITPGGTHIVFEGHRASEKTSSGGKAGLKLKTKSRGAKARGGGRGGKPKTRSARRAKAWKKEKGGR